MSNFFYENKFSLLYLILLVLLPVIFSSGILFLLVWNQELLTEFDQFQWFLFYLVSVFTMAFALTPTTFIALITGYYAGMEGALYAVPAYILASLVGYFAARFIDGGKIVSSLSKKEKTRNFFENLKEKEFTFIILSRLSPILPFALMNFVLSALRVNSRNFLMAGTIGMLPRTLLFIWVGSRGKDLESLLKNPGKENAIQFITVGLIILTMLGIIQVMVNALKKA